MIEVKIRDGSYEAFDKALKIFKKQVNNAGFLKEIQERKSYEKPSDKKRRLIRERDREMRRK